MTQGPKMSHGFMTETLSKPECEYVAEALKFYFEAQRDAGIEADTKSFLRRRTNKILLKMNMPELERDFT